MAVAVQCPKCKAPINLDGQAAGSVLVCGGCGQRLKVPAGAAGRLSSGSAGSAAAVETGKSAGATRNDRASSTEPTPSQRIGRFEIAERLGAGQSGTVYRAFDTVLKRDVALKVPQASLVDDDAAQKRFLREAEAAAQLRHPHIVPVYDAGREGDTFYIASAFIAGATLEKAAEANRPDFRQAADWVRKLASALAYAGGQGIVHRDVKPANIMLDQAGEPHLMDFGLARTAEGADKLTHDGSLMGTPAYMSPEQAGANVGPVSPASDQYSLGVVMYELLCGQRPFPEGNVLQVIYQIREKTPASPRAINPAVPRDLETICQKAMARQPADRYADCAALSEDLRRWLADEPIAARRLGLAERAVRWTRRNPAVAGLGALTAALLVVLGAGGAFAAWRQANLRDIADQRTADAVKERDAKDKLVVALEQSVAETRVALKAAEEKERQRAAEESRRKEEEKLREEAETQKEESIQEKEEAEEGEALARKHLAYAELLQPYLERLESSDLFVPPPRELFGKEPFIGWEAGFLLSASRPPAFQPWVTVPPAPAEPEVNSNETPRAVPPVSGAPTPCVWSGDGRSFVFVAGDGGLWALQVATGNVRALRRQGAQPWAIDSSSDGHRIAGACSDGRLRIWSLVDGTVRALDAPLSVPRTRQGRSVNQRTIDSPTSAEPLTGVAWEPGGSRIVVTRADGGLLVFDADGSAPATIPQQLDDSLTCVAWQPTGKLLALGDVSGKVHVWDGEKLKRRRTLPHSRSPIVQVAWSGDGEMLLIADHQSQAILRITDDQPSDAPTTLGPGPFAWDSQGARLLSPWGTADYGQFRLFDIDKDNTRELSGMEPSGEHPLEKATALAISRDGVAAAVHARMVQLLPLRSRVAHRLSGITRPHGDAVSGMAWVSNQELASAASDGSVTIFHPERNELRRLATNGPPILEIAGHRQVVYTLHEREVAAWPIGGGAKSTVEVRRLPPRANRIAAGGEPPWLAIAGEEIVIVSPEGKPVFSAPSNRGVAETTLSLQTGPHGMLFALSAGRESTPGLFARSWPGPLPFPSGGAYPDFCQLLDGGTANPEPTCAAAAVNTHRFVFGFADGRLLFLSRRPFDPSSTQLPTPPTPGTHALGVHCLAWSPREAPVRLATGGSSGSVIIWDASDGVEVRELIRLGTSAQTVTRLAWSPDGRYLAAGGDDGSITIWDGGPQE